MKYETRERDVAIKTQPKPDPAMKLELERYAKSRMAKMANSFAHADKVEAIAAALPVEKSIGTVKIGRPHSGKRVVSLRLDPDVIAKYRATGPGWQARMNDTLKGAKV